MYPERDHRTNSPDNSRPYRVAPRFILMQEIGSQAGGIFLMFACIILSLFLFHDLMSQSPWTWLLLTAGVVAVVFSLAYWIRKTIRQSIDEEKRHIEQAKKDAEAARLNRLAENRREEYAAKKEEALKQERVQQKLEELLARRGDECQLENDIFLTEIAEETSMLKIWNIWRKHQLAEENPEADAFILKHKETERMYGKLSNADSLKEELIALLR